MTKQVILSPEDVAAFPRPGMAVPGALAFSPDDQWIAYLFSPDHSLTRQLYVFNPQTGEHKAAYIATEDRETEESLSVEEKLRRERSRTRALGVTHHAWIPGTTHIMVPINGNLYVLDEIASPPRLLVSRGNAPVLDPQCSPDGTFIAYVRDTELYVVDVVSGEQRQLTFGAQNKGKVHGLAEYIAQEEMGRRHGFWWAPDSRRIAFTEVDESHIPIYRIIHQGEATTGDQAQEDHRYPFAGTPNAKVKLGVTSLEGGNPVWMMLGDNEDSYLARVQWWPDGTLVAQVENRAQTELALHHCDPVTGHCHLLLKEVNPVWINLHSMLKPLRDGRFIWASERTGFMHLYLYDKEGKLIHPLTSGPWMVESLAGVDEVGERVYLMGTRDSVLERHLYTVSLAGGPPQRLTRMPGFHEIRIDHRKKRFLDTFSAPEQPPQVTLHAIEDGTVLATLFAQSQSTGVIRILQEPDFVELQASDGEILHGMIYRPPASFGKGPYPTIISVYGGPHVQQVYRSWLATVDMRAQYLSRLGYLVFKLDNRGSARRGQAFESAVKYNMGDVEVQDQVAGVQWLADRGLADPLRVGIYGWSYGGYMALMCLARAPKIFKVAVAGAPVTHWDSYDTHYTERYMGTPEVNPDGYHISSVMTHVHAIEGKLLLVHGLIDENVHFRHTARLVNALIRANKPYDLLLFPSERHMPRRLEDRVYLEKKICEYFQANL